MRSYIPSLALPIFVLTLLLTLPIPTTPATATPTWTGTSYIQAGYKVIVLNGVHQSGTNVYTYTYSPAFSSTPFTALGLIGFEMNSFLTYLLKFKINIPNFTSTTSLQISMNFPSTTSWRQFRVSYIAIDARFNQLRVDYIQSSNLNTVTTGTGPRTYTNTFNLNIAAVDITHKISIIPLLIGLESHSVNGEHIFYWDTKLKTATQITYNLTADRTTHIFDLTSYILVVDRTNAESGYEFFMDELYIGGHNNTPIYQTPVFYNVTNMHAGLTSGSFSLLAFNFDKASFLLSTVGNYSFLNISVWSYRERTCPALQPYYELGSNLCYDVCPTGFVNSLGATKKYCKPCGEMLAACQLCTATGAACTQCVGNYVVSGGACACPGGYYVSSSHTLYADKCRQCDLSCLTCSGPSSSECASCDATRTLTGSRCPCTYGTAPNGACFASACSDQPCQQCNSDPSLCEVCVTGFQLTGARCMCPVGKYYDVSTVTCLACHYSCQYCSGPNSTQCTSCNRLTQSRYLTPSTSQCLCIQGYTEQNQTCTPDSSPTSCTEPGFYFNTTLSQCLEICGDGNRINLGCDDGNTEDGDGCTSSCVVEDGFVCSENVLAPNKRSFCSYAGGIQLGLVSTLKDIYGNGLRMNFTLQPTLKNILTTYPNLQPYLLITTPNTPASISSATYNPSTSLLQVSLSYTVPLTSQSLDLSLSMPQTALSYAIPVSSSTVTIEPENRLLAASNSEVTYAEVNMYKIMGMVCYIGGLCLFVVMVFFRKMIGLDYIVMMQLVYFSVMLSSYEHAYLGPIQEWSYINGYNQINSGISTTKLVDNSFWILGFYDYFFVNCNVMLFVCLVNYFLALILYGLSMLSDRSVSRKLKTSAVFFAVEIGYALFMFQVNNVAVSVFLEAEAGHIFSFQYGLDKFLLILALLMFCGAMGGYFYKIHDVNDSLFFYHRNKNYTHYYPFIFVLRNLLLIVFILLATKIGKISSSIVLGIQAGYIIAICAGRPYKRAIDYVRVLVVELTLLLLLVLRLIQANFVSNWLDIEASLSQFIEIGSIAVMVGMLLGLVMSLISFGFHLWKNRTQDPSVAPQLQANDGDLYVPPVGMSKSQQKFSLKQEEKSKELIVYDIEEEEHDTGAPGSDLMGNSYYQQSSRRKLRSRKVNDKSSKEFY